MSSFFKYILKTQLVIRDCIPSERMRSLNQLSADTNSQILTHSAVELVDHIVGYYTNAVIRRKQIFTVSIKIVVNLFEVNQKFCKTVRHGELSRLIGKSVGNSLNRKMMRDFRIYMAVGGMPQAVVAYTQRKNFEEIDEIKREIITLYKDDFYKIDNSGLIGRMYDSIPTQLATE